MLHVLKLALLEVAEDVQALQETAQRGSKCAIQVLYTNIFLTLCNHLSYLLAHERLAELQMVPLHDGGAVKFSQGMHAPTGQQLRNKLTGEDLQNFHHAQKV